MVLAAVFVVGTAAAAFASGTVGNPQPELKLFNVGANGGTGSGVILSDGTLVLASPTNSATKIIVCRLHPGERSCASTATLNAHSGDAFYGTVEVLATGGTDVSVVALDCCTIGADTAVVFDSTNDGRTFTALIKAGNLASIGTGTVAGGKLVVATYSTGGGTRVQAFPPSPGSPQTSFAVAHGGDDGNTSLTTYHNGVLVASDDTTNTHVEYASSGKNFNSTASYKAVGTFTNQLVTGVSGNALLTDPGGSLTGGERLRFFNGTSFGSSYKVPDAPLGDDGAFCIQETGGVVHVFFLNRRHSYDIYSETTRDGVHWSHLSIYYTAITAGALAPVLGKSGSGLVYETDTGSNPLRAQPILNRQSVHISLAHTTVKVGTSTTLSGYAHPKLNGQLVTLDYLSGGRWYTVTTKHESSTGTFSFTVPGATKTYRVVVAYKPSYYLYGYSNHVTLTASP